MKQMRETSRENAAGSEVRAGAPVRSVRTAIIPSLVFVTPRACAGRGVFMSVPPCPAALAGPHILS